MTVEMRDLLRVHACNINARDLEGLASQAEPDAPCFCDGEWVGEGPEGVRLAMANEVARTEEVLARMGRIGGEPVILEFSGGEGRWQAHGAVRIRGDADGRIQELRVTHDERIVRAAIPEPFR